MTYAEARRRARALLGPKADVQWAPKLAFPARITAWVNGKQAIVGAGATYAEALLDVEKWKST